MRQRLSRWFASIAAAALLSSPATGVGAEGKIGGILAQALARPMEAGARGFRARGGMIRRNRLGEVEVYALVTDTSEAKLDLLEEAGLRVDLVDPASRLVQGWVDEAGARRLALLPFVKTVREPDYLHSNVGSFASEGDAILQAALLRERTGADGAGVKVGVVSDGVFGLLEAVSSGDLPAGDKVCGNSGASSQMTGVGVQCRSFRSDGDITAGGDGSGVGAEGTALLEIIHDLAPGAELFFANAATSVELGRAQDWLADTVGVDVLVDDLAAFNVGPYDGTSSLSRKTSSQVAKGKVYVNAVGNYGNSHYVGWFTDGDGDGVHEFDASLGLAPTDGAGETLNVSVPAQGGTTIYVSWSDPFGAAAHDCSVSLVFPADCVDCDLKGVLGFDPCSGNLQAGTGDPVEVCGIAREESAAEVGLTIRGCPGVELQIFVTGEGTLREFLVPQRSVPNNSDARDVISVGAVGVVGDGIGGSPLVIRDYSSRGPTDDGRIKPALSATDGVTISGAGGFGISAGGASRFFGTSGATPHVAAVAAILKQLDPQASPACIAEKLAAAADLGIAGPDSSYGAGRVDAARAAAAACSPATCENVCCDLDGDCAGCAESDCRAILEVVGARRESECRADIFSLEGGAGAVDLLDATLCLRQRAGLGGLSRCACGEDEGGERGVAAEGCDGFSEDQTGAGRSCLWIGSWAEGPALLAGESLCDGNEVLLLFEKVTPRLAFGGRVTSEHSATLEVVWADLNQSGDFEEGESFAAQGEFSLVDNGARLETSWAGGTRVSIDGIPFERYRGVFQGFSRGGEGPGARPYALRQAERGILRAGTTSILPSGLAVQVRAAKP